MRTSTPLTISLYSVLGHLVKNPTAEILVIVNTSQGVIESLEFQRDSLISDSTERTTMVREHGIEYWREHCFLLAWEVGLLKAGFMKKWQIVIRKTGTKSTSR